MVCHGSPCSRSSTSRSACSAWAFSSALHIQQAGKQLAQASRVRLLYEGADRRVCVGHRLQQADNFAELAKRVHRQGTGSGRKPAPACGSDLCSYVRRRRGDAGGVLAGETLFGGLLVRMDLNGERLRGAQHFLNRNGSSPKRCATFSPSRALLSAQSPRAANAAGHRPSGPRAALRMRPIHSSAIGWVCPVGDAIQFS